MTGAVDWLRRCLPATPPALMRVMEDAVPAEAPSVAEALAEGALALFAQVARGDGGREDALPLLAADALLTHSFQARAEADPAGLREFAGEVGARGRLGRLG